MLYYASVTERTEILDVNSTLVTETGRGKGEVFAVRYEGAITSFGDTKAVDRGICLQSNLLVEI